MLKENKPRNRSKRKNINKTTLISCTIGVIFSVNICSFANTNAREVAKHSQAIVEIQNQKLHMQTIELENQEVLYRVREELYSSKKEINPSEYEESEDSFNAIYEEEIANQYESEDSYNAKVESEISLHLEGNEDSYNEEVGKEVFTELEMIEEENSTVFKFSQNDFELLCEITYAEAGNQTEEQQVAAAATILNRVGSSIFPNTIKEVIMQRGQFASTKNGHIYACGKTVDFSKVPDMTKEAARRALNGEDPTENWLRKEAKRLGLNSENYASGGALYFYSPKFTSPSELVARSNIKCKVQKGGHIFYKVWG